MDRRTLRGLVPALLGAVLAAGCGPGDEKSEPVEVRATLHARVMAGATQQPAPDREVTFELVRLTNGREEDRTRCTGTVTTDDQGRAAYSFPLWVRLNNGSQVLRLTASTYGMVAPGVQTITYAEAKNLADAVAGSYAGSGQVPSVPAARTVVLTLQSPDPGIPGSGAPGGGVD